MNIDKVKLAHIHSVIGSIGTKDHRVGVGGGGDHAAEK
jgi:hypothetical protein